MAKKTLPTNYVDDIMNVSANGNRKYRMIYNNDGTVSFEDVTPYEQVGSDYSAIDINTTNEAVNESFDKNKIVPDLTTINALTEQGYVPDALAVKQLWHESLEWKFLGKTTGKTEISLPAMWSEIKAYTVLNKNSGVVVSNDITRSFNKSYGTVVYRNGYAYGGASTTQGYAYIKCTETSVSLNEAYINQQDVSNNTDTLFYYK